MSQVRDPQELAARYAEFGGRLMHLQRAVDDFDVFARSLSIGAEKGWSYASSQTARCTTATRSTTRSCQPRPAKRS